jgi:hypothetical protein
VTVILGLEKWISPAERRAPTIPFSGASHYVHGLFDVLEVAQNLAICHIF